MNEKQTNTWSNGYFLSLGSIEPGLFKLSQMPLMTVPRAIPCVQGGEKVSLNEKQQHLGFHKVPCACFMPSSELFIVGEPTRRLTVGCTAEPPPGNTIGLILTTWTAFDMEAAGVIQICGPVKQPECIAKANMFIFTQRQSRKPGPILACT